MTSEILHFFFLGFSIKLSRVTACAINYITFLSSHMCYDTRVISVYKIPTITPSTRRFLMIRSRILPGRFIV